jgi:uncharacterized metal-binding protein YceD (DUF177 family)
MKKNRDFEIPHLSLQLGKHSFTFELGKDFFDNYSVEADYTDPHFIVHVALDKSHNHMLLNLNITGSINTICDRCGEELKLPIWDEFPLIIKWVDAAQLGDDGADEDADIVYISKGEHIIDLANWLYEFTILSIPIQRVHPNKEDGTSACNGDTLRMLEQHLPKENEQKQVDSNN